MADGSRIPFQHFPAWPRYLSVRQAAAYVGVSSFTFREEVNNGKWPPPLRRGKARGRLTWDKKLIDKYADRNSAIDDEALPSDDEYEKAIGSWKS